MAVCPYSERQYGRDQQCPETAVGVGGCFLWNNGCPNRLGRSLYLSVAMGNVPGMSSINKFGRNIEIDSGVTADIWDGGHTLANGGVSLLWVAPTAAAKHNIKSSSASDASGGVGARTIRIYGLPDWDTAEVNEDITMNGTTDVETVNSYVIIHRKKVLTKGATNVTVGVITATAKAPSATTITAQIRVGQGQTQMAMLGVPSTQKAYVYQVYANSNNNNARMALLYNPEPDAELLNFIVKHPFSLLSAGTSGYLHSFQPPKKFTGPGILKVQGYTGINDTDVSAGFDLVLVNN